MYMYMYIHIYIYICIVCVYIYIYILHTYLQLHRSSESTKPARLILGGTRCAELGGGWSTQIFSEIVGLLSILLNDSSQGKR